MEIKNNLTEVEISYSTHCPQSKLPQVCSSTDAYQILNTIWSKHRAYKEEFYCLFLNRSNRVLGYHLLSIGGTTSCLVDVKILVQLAIRTNSHGVIIAHNHPSGNLNPSQSDQKLTAKLKTALNYFDISLLDHLILDDGFGYFSMADEGEL